MCKSNITFEALASYFLLDIIYNFLAIALNSVYNHVGSIDYKFKHYIDYKSAKKVSRVLRLHAIQLRKLKNIAIAILEYKDSNINCTCIAMCS